MTSRVERETRRLTAEYRQRTPGSAALAASKEAGRIGVAQRAFGSVALPYPLAAKGGNGAYLYDVDGNRYLDLVAGWNSSYLGRGNPQITEAVTRALSGFGAPTGENFGAQVNAELAARLCELLPGAERTLFAPSGSEANSFAVRLARQYSGRDKILKFRHSYHGMYDDLMIGSLNTNGLPSNSAENIVLSRYNAKQLTAALLDENHGQLAAVIVEPISVRGNVKQLDSFLQFLRDETTARGIVLIFDEIVTGFRFSRRGAAGHYGIDPAPDLITLGKMLGGGLPVCAVVGRQEIMDGPINASSTHMQNPVCHAAALAFLDQLSDDLYRDTNALGDALRDGLREAIADAGLRVQVTGDCTNVGLHLVPTQVTAPDDSIAAHRDVFQLIRLALTVKGYNWTTDGFGISSAFQQPDVSALVDAFADVFQELKPAILEAAPELER